MPSDAQSQTRTTSERLFTGVRFGARWGLTISGFGVAVGLASFAGLLIGGLRVTHDWLPALTFVLIYLAAGVTLGAIYGGALPFFPGDDEARIGGAVLGFVAILTFELLPPTKAILESSGQHVALGAAVFTALIFAWIGWKWGHRTWRLYRRVCEGVPDAEDAWTDDPGDSAFE